jgi:hypothetical protein
MEKKKQFAKGVILTATLGLLTALTARITGLLVSPVQAQPRHSLAQATNSQDARGAVAQAANAAFRDGLHVGKIASERGSEPRISVGRWASPEDRAAYAAGYLQGYNQPGVDATR